MADDDSLYVPPESTPEFKFGALFNNARRTNADIREIRNDMSALHREVQQIPDKVMGFVNTALAAQTGELKPLLLDKAVDDENAKRRNERLQNRVNGFSTWAAVAGIVFGLVMAICAGVEAEKAVHPAVQVAAPGKVP